MPDYISQLNHYCLKNMLKFPSYEYTQSGPPHIPQFICSTVVNNIRLSSTGASKKAAKQNVSKKILDTLSAKTSSYGDETTPMETSISEPQDNDKDDQPLKETQEISDKASPVPPKKKKRRRRLENNENQRHFGKEHWSDAHFNFFDLLRSRINQLEEAVSLLAFIVDKPSSDDLERQLSKVAEKICCYVDYRIKTEDTFTHVLTDLKQVDQPDFPILTSWGGNISPNDAKSSSISMMLSQLRWLLDYIISAEKHRMENVSL